MSALQTDAFDGLPARARAHTHTHTHTHTQDHMDGGDDEGVHHDVQDGGDAAAKRHRKCPRYNEQQLRKLEAFYPIRDR